MQQGHHPGRAHNSRGSGAGGLRRVRPASVSSERFRPRGRSDRVRPARWCRALSHSPQTMALAATPRSAPAPVPPGARPAAPPLRFALVAVTVLFLMWGFLTSLNDILIPHLRGLFALSYVQAALVQFTFFGAYFLVAFPAGRIVERAGYQRGIVTGLAVAGVGAALFYPAAGSASYPLFLGALFVLASGITVLQVSANPYVTVLGPPETASSRLNLTQAFNSLGTTLAPLVGGALILGGTAAGGVAGTARANAAAAHAVQGPYMALAAALLVFAVVFAVLRLPRLGGGEADADAATGADGGGSLRRALGVRHLVLGAGAIFLYVGAEVAIGSFMVNFLGLPRVAGLAERSAAHYVSFYWGGALVGRFVGAALLQRVRPGALLAVAAAGAAALTALAVVSDGALAMWALLAVGLCNSIMFPTIFTLGIAGLGPLTGAGSSLLVMAIVGGALVPLAHGALADRVGLQAAFVLPAACYLYIVYYGLRGSRRAGAVHVAAGAAQPA